MLSNVILNFNTTCYWCFDSLNNIKVLTENRAEILKNVCCFVDLTSRNLCISFSISLALI